MLVFMENFSYFVFPNFKLKVYISISQAETVQARRVKKIYRSTDFLFDFKLPDIVVLELDEAFVLVPDVIEPACLPTQAIEIGTTCYVSGWGNLRRESFSPSSNLQAVDMKVVDIQGFMNAITY